MKRIEDALNDLPDFLTKYYWLVVEEEYSDKARIIIDEHMTGDPDDYAAVYRPIAEHISQGVDDGLALAEYLAACSPPNIRVLLAEKEHLLALAKDLTEKLDRAKSLAEHWKATGNGHWRELSDILGDS